MLSLCHLWRAAVVSARSAVVMSGLLFAAAALFGYQLFGWRMDGWVLVSAGVVHLAIVLRSCPRLDSFLIVFHYLLALAALGGVLWVLVDGGGTPRGAGNIILALCKDQWSEGAPYAFLGGYALLLTTVFLVLVFALSWFFHGRKPERNEVLTGLFVASILNIPCDFAIADALSKIVVLDPQSSRAFIFAAGVTSLDFPLILHGLLVIAVVAPYVPTSPGTSTVAKLE